jgi:hypothetical protein
VRIQLPWRRLRNWESLEGESDAEPIMEALAMASPSVARRASSRILNRSA